MSPTDIEPDGGSVGDLAALGRLLEEHRERLLRMLQLRIDPQLRPRLGAEDILQEAFLVARRRYRTSGPNPTPSTYPWLYRIAWDTLVEAWRKNTRGRRDVCRDFEFPDRSSIQMVLK